jgi:tetratricopeptide (TPR) repeat protein
VSDALFVVDAGTRVDFFISHAGVDLAWAEWVAWQLTEAGYTVELDAWNWHAGESFVAHMSEAIARCECVIALLSKAYFEPARFTTEEWESVVALRKRLVPLRIEPVTPPQILARVIYKDLFDRDGSTALQVLMAAVSGEDLVPAEPPAFPGDAGRSAGGGPRIPGSLPPVWNGPPRLTVFAGREDLLVDIRRALRDGRQPAVLALTGIGGVGKSQLAVEYACRFAGDYELIWWINAEQIALIGDQLAELATEAGIAPAGMPNAVASLRAALRGRDRWLLVFDNVGQASDVAKWVPQGPGQVIITSRATAWAGVALPLPVDPFQRSESIALIKAHVASDDAEATDELAQQLGDLPLALAQAVGVMTETGMSASEYLDAFAETTAKLLGVGTPADYPVSLAASVEIAIERLEATTEAAAQLARICAQFGPEPIPIWLLQSANCLPPPLREAATEVLSLRQSIGATAQVGLLRANSESVAMHRLTQATLRTEAMSSRDWSARGVAEALLVAGRPDDEGTDPDNWPRWSQLLPHILALDPTNTGNRDFMGLASTALWHLHLRGDASAALPLARSCDQRWSERLGPDDGLIFAAKANLGALLRDVGLYAEARELDEIAFAHAQRVLGDDDPRTFGFAHHLAISLRELGRYAEGRQLDEYALAGRRRILGFDHPHTLGSSASLAAQLRGLGQYEEALKLDEDCLTRARRVFGDDHPQTLSSAHGLAIDLRELDRPDEASQINRDTMMRRRRLLGEEHPSTLASANNLAADLRDLGEFEEARQLDEAALVSYRRALGEDHPDALRTQCNLCIDLSLLGRQDDARQLAEDTAARLRGVLGEEHPHAVTSAVNLATVLRLVGEYDQARSLHEEALARLRQDLGDDHPTTVLVARNLAEDIRLSGGPEQSVDA